MAVPARPGEYAAHVNDPDPCPVRRDVALLSGSGEEDASGMETTTEREAAKREAAKRQAAELVEVARR